jgi:protein-S-isoprenylcysteine O-methyltransferase Ste14
MPTQPSQIYFPDPPPIKRATSVSDFPQKEQRSLRFVDPNMDASPSSRMPLRSAATVDRQEMLDMAGLEFLGAKRNLNPGRRPVVTLPIETDEPPSRVPWPPILIAAAILMGRALDAATGPSLAFLTSFAYAPQMGLAIVALALVNDVWCARALWRHNTTILPHHAVTCLVADGPYRYSRNPIYVSHVALTLGIGLLLRSPGIIIVTPLLVLALVKLAVEPEERHLERKFGAEFEAYAARTRRWL